MQQRSWKYETRFKLTEKPMRKKQNELFVIIYFHIFDENLEIVSNYE